MNLFKKVTDKAVDALINALVAYKAKNKPASQPQPQPRVTPRYYIQETIIDSEGTVSTRNVTKTDLKMCQHLEFGMVSEVAHLDYVSAMEKAKSLHNKQVARPRGVRAYAVISCSTNKLVSYAH